MPRRIRVLPDHLANQIAAGEVVERPASVVKELVENALDAGAKRIQISVRNGGKTEIRVADDGCGMSREDALLSLDRHATSKIESANDLAAVRTLGFRGEALPSIASVSRAVLETAEREGVGTRLMLKGGQITAVEPCTRRVGTTVTVRSLFFNTPARAKFLRSTAVETRSISEVVTVLALSHPEVGFSLESNGRPLLDTPPAGDLRSRVADLWGEQEAAELIPVAGREAGISLSGLIQRPHAATMGGRRAYLFVNGRPFSDRRLTQAADRGYHTTIPPGVRPSFFLFLDVADGEVDVNVHPTKAEVRFQRAREVERVVEEVIRAGLQPLESAPVLGASSSRHLPAGEADVRASMEGGARTSAGASVAPAPSSRAPALDQMTLFVTGGRPPEAERGEPLGGAGEGDDAEIELIRPLMWQVHNTYIFAETRDGLIIVDQHAAHERILYEELMKGWEREEHRAAQRLLFPLTIRLSPSELSVVEELRSLFSRIGFEVEEFGGRSIIVHSVPNPHPYFDAERCLREMISELSGGSVLVDAARNQHQRLALSFACKAAVKAGQPLSTEEITELFDRLFATELPFHDIHGRPTVVQLTMHELHNRFHRSG